MVEDEHDMADMVCRFLRKEGYQTTHLDNGLEVEAFVKHHSPDLIILDLMLPGKDGISICRDIRSSSDIPIIIVTAKVSEAERLIGFDVGADDYVCKPFSAMELAMRVNVLLRRIHQTFQKEDGLKLDEERLCASYKNLSVDLTSIEFALIELLKSRPGNIYSRNFILDNIYQDYRIVSDRTVDSHIRNLRKKMKQLNERHDFVESVYGAGYRYVPATKS